MNYKDLVKFANDKLGDLFYPMFGNLYKRYTQEHIIKCINSFPKSKLLGCDGQEIMNPKAKVAYLGAICRNSATKGDILTEKKFDLEDFNI